MLIMLAVISSIITRQLGVYYLLGAFIVGVTAQRLGKQIPSITSMRMLHAIEVFASFFIPFYFFYAGTHVTQDDFTMISIGTGLAMSLIILPIRIFQVRLFYHHLLNEPNGSNQNLGVSLLPTLVFTLVLAELLNDRFSISPTIYGGLIIYAFISTMLPQFLFRKVNIPSNSE